jgi:hypothetical protein
MKELLQKLHASKLEIGKVAKNSKNPHFKNTYADLNALIDAVEPILLEKGLVLLQPIEMGKVYSRICDVETGDFVESFIDLPTTGTAQAIGSAITYYRRYTLQSLMSLQAVDDDGHVASQPQVTKPTIGEKAFNQAIERITNGERDLILKISNAYTLTPQQAVELNELV